MSEHDPTSGDPNRNRDKTKDIHIYLEGNDIPVVTIYAGQDQPKVVWAVRGPQDGKQALHIAEGIIAALSGVAPSTPVISRRDEPVKPIVKTRAMSVALREHILGGLTDEEVWVKIVAEYACGNDKRYRIKEYRKELGAKGELPAAVVPTPAPQPELPPATMPFRL